MRLIDRDSMRRAISGSNSLPGWQGKLALAPAVIGVAGKAIWFYRDAHGPFGNGEAAEGSLVVNINTATQEQLIVVPRLVPMGAAQVLAGHPYRTVDELVH